jgi:hypothetical protein
MWIYCSCYSNTRVLHGSSIIIRSCLIIVSLDYAALTEGLDKFSAMTSDRVSALKEVIHARWSASQLLSRETYWTLSPSKNFSILRTYAKYSTIFSLLSLNYFCTYLATKCESPLMRRRRMPRSLASRSLVTSRGDEHDASPCSFESVGYVKIHHSMIG